jgi:uncharacterized membrane protein
MGDDVLFGLGMILVLAIPVSVIGLILWAVRQSRRTSELEGNLRFLKAQIEELRPSTAPPPTHALEIPFEPEPRASPEGEPQEALPAAVSEGPWHVKVEQGDKDKVVSSEPPAMESDLELPSAAAAEYAPPKAVVFRSDRMVELGQWLQANWIYVVSAVSLATAGVFLVQYGIESGYLTPRARVWAALAFGAALVSAGEYLRRRWGDEGDVATIHLPSIFSSAGIVTLFAAILAARHLYLLIGSVTALAGLVATALLAIVLGWFSGPLLAAVGILGAIVAPFVVGGESDAPELFYGYFGIATLVGLLIDTFRRWAWVSVLSLTAGFGAAWLLYLGIGKGEWLMALSAALAIFAIAIPVKSLAPAHGGTAIIERLQGKRPAAWPEFPTNLAAGSLLLAVIVIALTSLDGVAEFWLSAALLLFLFAALTLWCWQAHAIEDLAALPAIGLVSLPYMQAMLYGDVFRVFLEVPPLGPEDSIPYDPILLAGAALVVSLLAAQRSFLDSRWPVAWAAGAAIAAPLMIVELEAFWRPADVIGTYPWALAAAVIAVAMGVLAERFARADGAPGLRSALVTLSALLMICFALMVMLSETALTLALSIMVLAAAALDRRFGLPPLMWFVKAGVIVVGWRLVIDPGLFWAEYAPYWELFAAYAGVVVVFLSTRVVLRSRDRDDASVVTESAAGAIAAVFASVLVYRLIDDFASASSLYSHWAVSLIGLVWFISAANLIWRLQIGGPLKAVRKFLIAIYILLGSAFLGASITVFNPLTGWGGDVLGPAVINTLFVAYMLPAILFAFVAWKFSHISRLWRFIQIGAASALATLWLGLNIRHFWHGPDLSAPVVTQAELYTYTVAMLVVGAGLLYQAIASGSPLLRRVAMSVIALTVAKVFLIDASGLTGLTRVFSFLALGLSLAGLAFLNRWAAGQEPKRSEDKVESSE